VTNPSTEPGADLILDNRKLILGFGILILLCGAFFVLGFVEGKRQVVRAPAEPQNAPGERGAVRPGSSDDKAMREQLEWYRNVKPQQDARKQEPAQPPAVVPPAAPPAQKASAPATTVPGPATRQSATVYSVQVGAFRQLKEAESKASMLGAKGYRYVIEPPKTPDGLYLLKVGRYDSRTEAVATQLRLKKDGFSTLIKSN
jgi:cell division protein FtsN